MRLKVLGNFVSCDIVGLHPPINVIDPQSFSIGDSEFNQLTTYIFIKKLSVYIGA